MKDSFMGILKNYIYVVLSKTSINSLITCSLLTFSLSIIIVVCPSPSRTFLTFLIKIPLWPSSKNS